MKVESILTDKGYIKRIGGEILYTASGKKLKTHIEEVIRKKLNKIEGMEMEFPLLVDYKKIQMDDLLRRGRRAQCIKLNLKENREVYLVRTCEELAAAYYARQEIKNCIIYQIKTKFRDEAEESLTFIKRNEFQMADIYSFEQEQNNYYEQIRDIFIQICNELFIPVDIVKSEEYMEQGIFSEELYSSVNGEMVEIGHIYDFADYYAKAFNKGFRMGSYGLGIDRLFACFVMNVC
ncbi:MAG: hypothetical protein K2M78_09730 [Lachnospiraceae bacterium]|nr:hypothetical protein [Lachnospiraceae bacterium]